MLGSESLFSLLKYGGSFEGLVFLSTLEYLVFSINTSSSPPHPEKYFRGA